MSKILKGPPGSPLGLCSGTSMTSIKPIVPFLSVPQTGQFLELLLQLLEMNITPSRATRDRSGSIFGFIKFPPTKSAGGRTKISRKTVQWVRRTPGFASAGPNTNQQPDHPEHSRPDQ